MDDTPDIKSADWLEGYMARDREIRDRIEAEIIARIPEAIRLAMAVADAKCDLRNTKEQRGAGILQSAPRRADALLP